MIIFFIDLQVFCCPPNPKGRREGRKIDETLKTGNKLEQQHQSSKRVQSSAIEATAGHESFVSSPGKELMLLLRGFR